MDALLLSRWQFAITTTYHFLFVPITLGLSFFLALLETCYVRTTQSHRKKLCRQLIEFFGTIFLVSFVMGVVTGIVQEFHFGMNWSEYSRFMGDIFGAPLALEALTAFFLESTFLGIWVFGWDRLSEKLHCACIWMVAIGSNLSAFWILVANSFMQHPTGFALENGRAVMTNFLSLLANPYVAGEYSHTLFASIATAGFIVLTVSAWKILHDEASRYAFTQALKAGVFYTLLGLFGVMGSGHLHTQYLAEANPMKLSALEALWESADPAPFAIAADINMEKSRNDSELAIPGAFSWLLYSQPSGEVKGINALQKEYQTKYGAGDYRPDVPALFWSFRIMLVSGVIMSLLAIVLGLLAWTKQLSAFPLLLKSLPFLLPLPFLANSTGWFLTEAGRQPWIVVGLQRTADAVSQNLAAGSVWLTVIGFSTIYLLLAAAACYVVLRHIRSIAIPEEGGNT